MDANEKIPTAIELTITGKLTRDDTGEPLRGVPVDLHMAFEPLTPENWKKWHKETEGDE